MRIVRMFAPRGGRRPAAAAAGHGSVRPVGRRSAHRRDPHGTRQPAQHRLEIGRPDSGVQRRKPLRSALCHRFGQHPHRHFQSGRKLENRHRRAALCRLSGRRPDERALGRHVRNRPVGAGRTILRIGPRRRVRHRGAADGGASTTIRRWASRSHASKRRPAAGSRSPEKSRWRPRRELRN